MSIYLTAAKRIGDLRPGDLLHANNDSFVCNALWNLDRTEQAKYAFMDLFKPEGEDPNGPWFDWEWFVPADRGYKCRRITLLGQHERVVALCLMHAIVSDATEGEHPHG